jgi:opacity protein-like surface antigen
MAIALSAFAVSQAQAQNCIASGNQFASITSSPASIGAMIGSSITAASTAFLLQSSAFIGSPGNPSAGQQGGGMWARTVGGEIDVKSNTSSVGTTNPPSLPATPVPCEQKIHEDFLGVQIGADISRLNINGWNTHVGVTAGYLDSKAQLIQGAFSFTNTLPQGISGIVTPLNEGGGPFNGTVQVPFAGIYAAATKGSFFVDGLLRFESYQVNLNAPLANLFSQNTGAHGVSFSGSIGYNYQIPNTKWFVEPSAGVIISRTTVDPFNYVTAGIPGLQSFSGTLQLDQIKSDIGRVGIRVGTSITSGNMIWQPFAAVSAWHEFGPDLTSNYATCNATIGGPGCAFVGGVPTTFSVASSTTTFGTYGQYSLGFSAAVSDTGWLGFARVDYRHGPNVDGLSGTGGIRYQFTPEKARRVAKDRLPAVELVNWSGFYIGGFGSALLGTADWNYVGGSATPHVGGYLWGGDIGYNWQYGVWVLGVEADLGRTNVNGATACGPLLAGLGTPASPTSAPMFQMTCDAWANWLATATARVGYAWERALTYVKAGGAWTREQVSAICNLGAAIQFANSPVQSCRNPAGIESLGFTGTRGQMGWLVGIGTEFALTRHWSAKAEYNYISFGDRNLTANDGSLLNVGMHINEVKVGVNYRFDNGVVAVPLAAYAADLRPPISKAPVYVPTWTGFYIGGSAGVGWSKSETDLAANALSCTDNSGLAIFGTFFCPAVTTTQVQAVPPTLRTHPMGGLLGGQIGYNYQFGAWVAGIETDLSWTNIDAVDTQSGSAPLSATFAGIPVTQPGFANATAEQRLKYFGTLRGRLGVLASDPLLLFVTGGLAYGHQSSSTALVENIQAPNLFFPAIGPPNLAGNASGVGYASTVRAGWTAGFGLEYAFAKNWSVKAEYLYFNLGSVSYPVVPLHGVISTGLITTDIAVTATTTDFAGNIVRVGLNYKLD